jgi:uncharacterized protein (TIGR02145 family)
MKKYINLFVTLALVLSSCESETPIPTFTFSTTVSPTDGGKIIVSPQSPDYKAGDVVTMTVQANEHWVFKQWEGDASGSSSPLQLTIDSNKSVVGVFIKRNYLLTISITGQGTVEEKVVTNPGGREYPHGTTVELTPKPIQGWIFESWGGDLSGTEFPKKILVDRERKVEVRFIRSPTITSLNCNSASNNGTLTAGVPIAGVVNSLIPYDGGVGGAHSGQIVNSTGVAGLTATLVEGTFANGSGNLTYTISGTPSAVGVASFAINIGGKTCVLTRSVIASQPSTTIGNITNPISGKTWMDRNLGASRVAISITDAEAYGDLYQWGRGSDGHQKRTSGITTTLSSTDVPGNGNFILTSDAYPDWRSPQNNNLWQGVNGVNNPCPNGYRLPTETELNAERISWSSNNSAGAYASPLKLPMAGNRVISNGSLGLVGARGIYWSSTVSGNNSRYLIFLSSTAAVDESGRAFGSSVRCIKD